MAFFKVIHQSSKSKARLGTMQTDHGTIQTPAFVPVSTKGTIKGLTQEQIKELKIQFSCVNTYHLVTHPGVEVLERAGGVYTYAKYSIPLMSDSGGFQVFSLAQRQKKHNSIVIPVKTGIQEKNNDNYRLDPRLRGDDATSRRTASIRGEEEPLVEKISEDGVLFRSVYDGQLIHFTPETSMDFQRIIGADINMAFDECTYYPATHEYTEKAMERTHRWLERCIQYRKSETQNPKLETNLKRFKNSNFENSKIVLDFELRASNLNQYLYGIIQGGMFEDLRKKSAEFVMSRNTPGIAIGGVSVGESKEEMRNQVRWIAPYLPKDRPVHLLGVGQVDDIVDLVKQGIDTFDCVEPTRVARMGSAYQTKAVLAHIEGIKEPYELDINKAVYKGDLSQLDEDCSCSTCVNYTKSYLHHLFKQRELLGYTLLSYHNLFVMEKLMEKIQGLIGQDKI